MFSFVNRNGNYIHGQVGNNTSSVWMAISELQLHYPVIKRFNSHRRGWKMADSLRSQYQSVQSILGENF